MKKRQLALGFAGVVLIGGVAAPAQGADVIQERAFGTIAKGSTVCVGPLAPTGADGVQIFGFTNGEARLTWQVLTVSSQSAPTVVFETTGTTVSHVVPPSGNLLFEACVVKTARAPQDFDVTLNSAPLS